jgi:cytoskeletal protein CcmA (bactofilin family)
VAKHDKPGHLDTLIGAHTVLEGNIESEGGVRVDGTLRGDLKIGGDVSIGPDATITGNICANNVVLAGKVEGNITANGMLRLLSKARLNGNVQAHGLVADEGGIFHGKCNIVEERQRTQRERESVPSPSAEQAEKPFKSRAALRRPNESEGAPESS